MSCHFFKLRKRRAAEAALKAAEAVKNTEKVETKADDHEEAKAAQKVTKSRKKGDAK